MYPLPSSARAPPPPAFAKNFPIVECCVCVQRQVHSHTPGSRLPFVMSFSQEGGTSNAM